MANRVLRDWTDSENIDKLSFQAEVTFTRLFMKADDYGCFHANPKLVKAALFPLKNFKDVDVHRWLDEIYKAGLIAYYGEEGKKYLIIKNFGQRLRAMRRRFPEPDSNSLTIDSNPPPETETKQKQETENKKGKQKVFVPPTLLEVKDFFKEKGYSEQSAIKAFDYYNDANPPWTDRNGDQVRSWKSKMNAVWFKPENKEQTLIQKSAKDTDDEIEKYLQTRTS